MGKGDQRKAPGEQENPRQARRKIVHEDAWKAEECLAFSNILSLLVDEAGKYNSEDGRGPDERINKLLSAMGTDRSRYKSDNGARRL